MVQEGTLSTNMVAGLALTALCRNRGYHRALLLAEDLANLGHPEVRLLDSGLLTEQGSLTDLEVGGVLLRA